MALAETIAAHCTVLQALLAEHRLLNHHRTALWEARGEKGAAQLARDYQDRLGVLHEMLVAAGVLDTNGQLTDEARAAGIVTDVHLP